MQEQTIVMFFKDIFNHLGILLFLSYLALGGSIANYMIIIYSQYLGKLYLCLHYGDE